MPVANIDPRKCDGCGKCVDTCPEDVLRLNLQPVPQELKSPCAMGCPAGISVRKYSYYVEMGMMEEAITELKKYNPLPAVTGRICNHLCEKECARKDVDEAVNIKLLERYVADYFRNVEANVCKRIYSGNVAIIGSGPAGLAAAYFLCNEGFGVTVFEKEQRAGGMLSMAIPDFRLERDIVEEQISYLMNMGIEFKLGVNVGKDITIPELKANGFDAIFIAPGLQGSSCLGIDGDSSDGVFSGIDYMKSIYLKGNGQLNGNVIVIGGGNIAADVARTAIRKGASSVKLYCLETYDEMPMGSEDRIECEKDGIIINAGWGPKEIKSKNSKCSVISFKKCISVINRDRFDPVFDESIVESVDCDYILYCIGQKPEWEKTLIGTDVKVNERGLILADRLTYQTDDECIFAGGDAYSGQKFVVDAIASGREAAISISRFLRGVDIREGRMDYIRVQYPPKEGITLFPRQTPGADSCFTDNQAMIEARRCMTCGSRSEIIYPDDCMVCLYCMRDCPHDAITITPDRIARHIEPWDLG